VSNIDSLRSDLGNAVRRLEACELEAVTGSIGLGGFAGVPAGVVFCPPAPPPSTHIDLSRLAGLALAQG
jgi:hypothetical protein